MTSQFTRVADVPN